MQPGLSNFLLFLSINQEIQGASKHIDKNDLPVDYYAHKMFGWIQQFFTQWFKQKFVPHCRRALKDQGLLERAILLLDNAPSHPDVDLLQSDDGEISCIYLPPNTTSLIQAMDQGVLENIKRRYKCDLLLRLLDDEADSRNMADFSKTLMIKDAILMSARSWDEVKAGTIIKSWSKLLKCQDVSDKEVEGAGDDVDVNSLLNDMDVPSEEKTDWLTADERDPGYREFSEEEIVSIARDENTENAKEEDDEEITPLTVSHAKACQALQTVLMYLEQQPKAPMGTMVILTGLLLETAKRRVMNQRQTKINDYFSKL